MGGDEKAPWTNLPIPERIRRRREDRGMTGAELAKLVGVSPAYISLIETGAKVPRVSKAADIATSLDDDPALYRAWALASKGDDAQRSWSDLESGAFWSSAPSRMLLVSSGLDLDEMLAKRPPPVLRRPASQADSVSRGEAAPTPRDARSGRILEVPVLEPGADPGSGPEVPENLVIDRLFLDARLVRGERLTRPFCYRVGGGMTDHLQGEARPGDWVVLSSAIGKVSPEAVFAVRLRKRLVLSRVVSKGDSLLLPPGEGKRNIEVIDLGDGGILPHLAGRVALVVRRGD